ncbi:MAG TPA: GH1 family beta-glucosidase [Ktedonobacterales bacterium]
MTFPRDFLWGAATSAYQIEGAVHEDGRGPSTWDAFSAEPGRTYLGQTGEVAADHYHRAEQDVSLMAELGLNAYRFSIAWPRIVPDGSGKANTSGLDFYSRLVDRLLAVGITPVATLYHWDLPLALYERGGWRSRDTALAMAEYAEVMAAHLGDRVQWWLTQNEPWCSAYLGYGAGEHAPGIRGDTQAAVDVGHHLLLSHGLAIPRIRAHVKEARIGMALNLFPIFAGDQRPETLRTVQRADRFHNRWFLDPLCRGEYTEGLFDDLGVNPPPIEADDMAIITTPTDFLGVNYYNRWIVRASGNDESVQAVEGIDYVPGASHADITAMGWEVYPHGLDMLLEELNRAYRPPALLITENGAAFDDEWNGVGHIADTRRVRYLRDHLCAVERAIDHGVPVAGYFAWSLIDNYEWAMGYSKRFGLIYVDFETQRRVIKDSGRWYAGYIAGQRAM